MIIAVDFETALAEPGLQAPPPVCMSLSGTGDLATALPSLSGVGVRIQRPTGEGWIVHADDSLPVLQELLQSTHLLVGLNMPYDMGVACAAWSSLIPSVFAAYDADRIEDVQIRQKLVDIALGEDRHGKYGMADLAKDLLGRRVEKEDTWRLRYWDLVHLPLSDWPQDALEYPVDDAITTLDLRQYQQNGLTAVGRLCVLEDQYRQARADFVLHLISSWGLRTDPEGCALLRQSCETEQGALQQELLAAGLLKYKYAGRKPNKRIVGISLDTKSAKQRILDDAHKRAPPGEDGWKIVKLSPTGVEDQRAGKEWRLLKYVSTNKEACADCSDPIMEKYTQYAQLGNMLSGFVKAIEQGTVTPIHTRFEVLQDTGRTSSSSPNVQNVRAREGSRECFRPRDGWVFIGCDIDRAELHTLAQACINLFGHSTLGDSLNAGIDPHTKFGARLAGCSYADLEARVAAGDDEASKLRKRAKPANFGLPGGMGWRGLQRYAKGMYRIVLTDQEAQGLKRSWEEEYPDIAGDYLGWIAALCRGTGYTTIEHFGSKRWRGNVRYTQAANSFFQGMAADALKQALWDLAKKCYLPGTALYGCRMVNEVHDEVIIEAPIVVASDAAHEVQRTIVAAYNTYTRDVPVSATPVLMDRWSKKAKTLVDDGVYRIWRYS